MKYETLEEREKYLFSYLTGVIFGDGCIHPNPKIHRIDIYNSNKEYVGVLLSILNKILPNNAIYIYCRCRKTPSYCLSINNKKFKDTIKQFKNNYRYEIPTWISTKSEKAGFISGLFDTDGCVWKRTIPINLTTKYRTSLESIKEALRDDFEIDSYIHSYQGISRLNIKSYKNLAKFEKEIGFLHPLKKELLRKLLENFYVKEKMKLRKEQEVKMLYKKGVGIAQISNIVNTPKTTIICWLDEYFPNRIRKREHSVEDYYKAMSLFKLYTINQIVELLKIPESTLKNWFYKHTIPNLVRREPNG